MFAAVLFLTERALMSTDEDELRAPARASLIGIAPPRRCPPVRYFDSATRPQTPRIHMSHSHVPQNLRRDQRKGPE